MSDFVISPKAQEITLPSTANTVNSASLVRLLNTNATTARVITKKDGGGTTIGTITIQFGQDMIIYKNPSDTIQVDTGTDVKAVSIAFR